MPTMECLYCYTEIEAKRTTKKFCSANCRVKYNGLTPEQIALRDAAHTKALKFAPPAPKTIKGGFVDPGQNAVVNFKKPSPEAYDAPKMPTEVQDEPSKYAKADTSESPKLGKLSDIFKDQPKMEGNAHTPVSGPGQEIIKKRRGF